MVRVHTLHLLGDWIDQARSFSDLVVLNRFGILACSFDIDADRAHFSSFSNVDPILVNAFDNDLPEIPILVRSKHHHLVKLHRSLQDGAS